MIGKKKMTNRRPYGSFALSLTLALLASLVVVTAAYAAVGEVIQGNTATSQGAGNEKSGDAKTFKNAKRGTFIDMRSSKGDFEVQSKQQRIKRGSTKVYNIAVAVKVSDVEQDRVIYDAKTNSLTYSGKPLVISNGEQSVFSNGGKAEKLNNVYTITSKANDKVTITDKGKYANVKVEAGPDRLDEDKMIGSLGRIDSDTDPNNDLVDRNGTVVSNVGTFIEGWRAQSDESLFPTEQAL